MEIRLVRTKFTKVAIALWEKQPVRIGLSFYRNGCIQVWHYPKEAEIIAEYIPSYVGDKNLEELTKLEDFYKNHVMTKKGKK